MNRKQAIMSYKMIYFPSLKYSLAVCLLSLNDINYTQRYLVDKFVTEICLEHTMDISIVYGPVDYGGI